jgi:hypothetical protein
MRRVSMVAVAATIGLAVPFTLLGLAGAAWLTENMRQVSTTLANAAAMDWRALALEGWARLPEIAGMVIGQALIMVILLLARREVSAGQAGVRHNS